VEVTPPAPAALPPLDALYRESGRAILERIVRRKGAARPAVLAELAAGWSAGTGAPGPADIDRLLEHHGLARAFEERERALVLHTYRKHGGVGVRVARELGLPTGELAAALSRLGLERPVEAIRDARRRALDRKATLSERARLVDEEEETLADLGLLPRVEEDLRRRLPEQLRALAVGGRSPSAADVGRSLSLGRAAVERLVVRFALPLRPSPAERDEGRPSPRGPPRGRPRGPSRGPARRRPGA
jgi:hypothetical protein